MLKPCRWRILTDSLSPGRFGCRSPKVIVSPSGITERECEGCVYTDHDVPVTVQRASMPLPVCKHLGQPVPPPIGRDRRRTFHSCELGYGPVCSCQECEHCAERAIGSPLHIARIPLGDIALPSTRAFNPSICRFDGRLLLAYRVGWGGGGIRIATLAEDFRVVDDVALDLRFPHCSFASEDPRLFVHRDRLYLSFCGVEVLAVFPGIHVLYTQLTDDLRAVDVVYPHFSKRTRVEKNWVFFSDAQQLYAVYSSHPHHQILRVDRNAVLASSTPTADVWRGGLIRGGAAPVLHDGQWYHWFHGHRLSGSHVTYSMGLLTFDRYPPFRVTRITPLPVMASNPRSNPQLPAWQLKSVIFPAGAIFTNGHWHVSYGLHDAYCEIATFSAEDVGAWLVDV